MHSLAPITAALVCGIIILFLSHIHLDMRPELKYIDLITWRDGEETSEFRLIDHIRDRCDQISRRFEVSKAVYDDWVNNDPGGACHKLIDHWLRSGCGPYSVTWNGFIKVMKDVELGEVAKDLEKALQKKIE